MINKVELPKISIVTPNFNGSKYLEATIHSVLDQGYPNLEYIIIDGSSTDKSQQIIKKYEDYLAYWVSEPDSGMYDAIQKGFDKSTGEIMAWLNSDDMYHTRSLFTVAKLFRELPNVNWVTGCNSFYDDDGNILMCRPARCFSKYDFYLGDFKWVQQESTFWRRSVWEKSGSSVDRSLKYAGDFELWMRFFRIESLFVTNALLGGWRKSSSGEQSSIKHIEAYMEEVYEVLRAEDILDKDKNHLRKIKRMKKILQILKTVKFLNNTAIDGLLLQPLFKRQSSIHLEFETMTFKEGK